MHNLRLIYWSSRPNGRWSAEKQPQVMSKVFYILKEVIIY